MFPNHLIADSRLVCEEGGLGSWLDVGRGVGVLCAVRDRDSSAPRAVSAKLSVEQIIKYALAAAALEPPGRVALVYLGPAKSLQSVNA